jgi:hypothetical protein
MYYRLRKVLTGKLSEFSRRTVLSGGLFISTLVVAVFVDLDGLLEYFKLVTGSAFTTVETGAVITLASAVPFLAMGMSISADTRRNKSGANEAG